MHHFSEQSTDLHVNIRFHHSTLCFGSKLWSNSSDLAVNMLGICPLEKKKRVEKNKKTNANTCRVPEKRNLHLSLMVKVKKGDEGHLEGL